MIGASQASSRTRWTISGTAAAAASLLTVTRTSSEPARASATICAAVDAASAVSVFVIDCTTTGCDDPTGTCPTRVVTVCLRGAKATSVVIEAFGDGRAVAPTYESYHSFIPRTMPDDIEQPPRGYTTEDVKAIEEQEAPAPKRRRFARWKVVVFGLLLIPVLVFALWTWWALSWAYSENDQSGWVQKLSRKGWICKTWEGELAVAPNVTG